MNYCKQCISEFEGKPNKDGICPACVEANAYNKAQAKKLKAKAKKAPKKK